MQESLSKWLTKQNIEVALDATQLLCKSLGLSEEKRDACLGLVYRFEKDEIDKAELMQGLLLLSGKSLEDLRDSLVGREVEPLAAVCYNSLATHGLAVHYEILTRMVQDSFPELDATGAKVLSVLSRHQDLFEKLETGVYWLRGKREGQVYPQIGDPKWRIMGRHEPKEGSQTT